MFSHLLSAIMEWMGWLREFWNHFWGRGHDEPSPDRIVEVAWVPAWRSQILTDELIAAEIPARVVDDYSINLLVHSREPMARIFVPEDRRVEAERFLKDRLGYPPGHRPI